MNFFRCRMYSALEPVLIYLEGSMTTVKELANLMAEKKSIDLKRDILVGYNFSDMRELAEVCISFMQQNIHDYQAFKT